MTNFSQISHDNVERIKAGLIELAVNHLGPTLWPDADLTTDTDNVAEWADEVASLLLIPVTHTLHFNQFPDPPKKREPITMEALFMDFAPSVISLGDLTTALDTFNEVVREGGTLDEDEDDLLRELRYMEANLTANRVWVIENSTDDHLNSLLPNDLPDWLEDHIDYERAYASVLSHADSADLVGRTYYALDAGDNY